MWNTLKKLQCGILYFKEILQCRIHYLKRENFCSVKYSKRFLQCRIHYLKRENFCSVKYSKRFLQFRIHYLKRENFCSVKYSKRFLQCRLLYFKKWRSFCSVEYAVYMILDHAHVDVVGVSCVFMPPLSPCQCLVPSSCSPASRP